MAQARIVRRDGDKPDSQTQAAPLKAKPAAKVDFDALRKDAMKRTKRVRDYLATH